MAMTQPRDLPPVRPPPPAEGLDLPDQGDGPTVFVHPGQLFASADPVWISTILGTCVAVCLWDPIGRMGGLNHYLLPHWVGNSSSASPKFGSVAIHALIDKVVSIGARQSRLQAKVFGGMSRAQPGVPKGRDLGTNNSDLAFKLLAEAQIPVVAQNVGGERGRRILFNLKDGSTWVKQF